MKYMILALVMVSITGCSGNIEEKLDGKWKCEPIGYNVNFAYYQRLNFNYKNGSVKVERPAMNFGNFSGTYKVTGSTTPMLEINGGKRNTFIYKITDFPSDKIMRMVTDNVLPEMEFECYKD